MKGKIYRLYNSEASYIGSTIHTLFNRKGQHKRDYKRWINGKKDWVSSFILYMFDEALDIELIEEIEFKDKTELLVREGYYMNQYDCVNEKNTDGKTIERQRARNKEKVQCECGAIISRNHIPNHRRTKKHLTLINL